MLYSIIPAEKIEKNLPEKAEPVAKNSPNEVINKTPSQIDNRAENVKEFVSKSSDYKHLSTKSLSLMNYSKATQYRSEIRVQVKNGKTPRFLIGGWRNF